MVQIENKIAIFNNIVFVDKEKKLASQIKEAKKNYIASIAAKKEELEKMSEELINRRKLLAEKSGNELISKVNEANRIARLHKDDELLDDLLIALEEKAKSYIKTDTYKKEFLHDLEDNLKTLDPGAYNIFVTNRDFKVLSKEIEKIGKKYDIQVKFNDLAPSKIGGFVIVDDLKTYRIDASLKSRISESRYNIGKFLHFKLKGNGDVE